MNSKRYSLYFTQLCTSVGTTPSCQLHQHRRLCATENTSPPRQKQWPDETQQLLQMRVTYIPHCSSTLSVLKPLQTPGSKFPCPHLLLFACSRLSFEDAGIHSFHGLYQQAKKFVVKTEHELWKEETEVDTKSLNVKKDFDRASNIGRERGLRTKLTKQQIPHTFIL